MKTINYIFFSCILLLLNINVYANNSYVISSNHYDDIKNKLNENNNIAINLTIDDELILKRKVLDLIKEKDKSITYNVFDGENIIYSFVFNGKNITKSYNDINLRISCNYEYKNNIIEETFKKNKNIIKLEYQGYFPPDTILKIKGINKNAYNIIDNEINKLDCNYNNNFISFNIKKGEVFILSNQIIDNGTNKIYNIIILIIIFEIIILLSVYIFKKNY